MFLKFTFYDSTSSQMYLIIGQGNATSELCIKCLLGLYLFILIYLEVEVIINYSIGKESNAKHMLKSIY